MGPQVRFCERLGGAIPRAYSTADALDRETQSEHLLFVTARETISPGRADTAVVTVTVEDVNEFSPTLSDATFSIAESSLSGEAVGMVAATDADATNGGLTYSISDGNELGIFAIDGSGKITVAQTTLLDHEMSVQFTLTVEASDNGPGDAKTGDATVTIHVTGVNEPPQLDSTDDQSVNEGEALLVRLSASDPDLPADALKFVIDSASTSRGMTINPETGLLSWTPSESQGPGQYDVTVTVTDDGNPPLSAEETFTISVNEVNTPPILSETEEQSVSRGQLITLQFTSSDADLPRNTLTFSLDAASAALGMVINSETGEFNWTPTDSQEPGELGVTVTVTDDASPGLKDDETFSITLLVATRAASS